MGGDLRTRELCDAVFDSPVPRSNAAVDVVQGLSSTSKFCRKKNSRDVWHQGGDRNLMMHLEHTRVIVKRRKAKEISQGI